MDCYAAQSCVLGPGERRMIPLGFAAEIPDGYEIQIRPRSGLARDAGVASVLGTIDAGYRGEIGATLINHGHGTHHVFLGEKVCQAVLAPVVRAEVELADELAPSERGERGFGSTGR